MFKHSFIYRNESDMICWPGSKPFLAFPLRMFGYSSRTSKCTHTKQCISPHIFIRSALLVFYILI